MVNVNQAPVNLRVSNLVNLGGYPKGYTIINKSLTATIWVASNPSVADGTGTPIYPSTSLVWDTDGTLFANLGIDANSIAAGFAEVTISYDTQLWQPNPVAIATAVLNSGVIIVDNPVTVLPTVSPVTNTNNLSAMINMTRYNSLELFATVASITAGSASLTVFWYNDLAGSQYVGQDNLLWSVADFSQWAGSIPARAAFMRVRVQAIGGGTVSITYRATASYRIVPAINQSLLANSLMNSNVIVAAASNSATFYSQPWIGDFEVSATMTGGIIGGNYCQITRENGYNFFIPLDGTGGSYAIGGLVWNKVRFSAFGEQIGITFHNNGPGSQQFFYLVNPIRYNP